MLTIFIGAMEQKALGMALDFLLNVRITERQIIRHFNIILKSLFSFFFSPCLFLFCSIHSAAQTLPFLVQDHRYVETQEPERRSKRPEPFLVQRGLTQKLKQQTIFPSRGRKKAASQMMKTLIRRRGEVSGRDGLTFPFL